jgi:hypothetical protein
MLEVEVPRISAMRDGAVLLARRGHRFDEAVGLQAHPGQPVVAAVPGGQRLGQAHVFDPVDAADPCGQGRIAEVVGTQAAARVFERVGQRRLADADGRGRRVGADLERGNAGRHDDSWSCDSERSRRSVIFRQ